MVNLASIKETSAHHSQRQARERIKHTELKKVETTSRIYKDINFYNGSELSMQSRITNTETRSAEFKDLFPDLGERAK